MTCRAAVPPEGPGKESAHRETVEEFQAFLQTHIDDLRIHPPTTYDLLASYGRRDEMLLYATLIEDLDRVIASYIQERSFLKALQVLTHASHRASHGWCSASHGLSLPASLPG